ncbi:MAG: hypothetical protein MPJ53_01530 [Alphaproteobacteria bacterium]|nr:hypothetical protein [Alphaproteobacteria bacterium]
MKSRMKTRTTTRTETKTRRRDVLRFALAGMFVCASLTLAGCGRRGEVRAPDGAPEGWGERRDYPAAKSDTAGE